MKKSCETNIAVFLEKEKKLELKSVDLNASVKPTKSDFISLLFDVIVNKNKDASEKLKLESLNDKNKDKDLLGKDKKDSLDQKLLGDRFKEVKDVKEKSRDGKILLELPFLRYLNLQEQSKVDYGALFSYMGKMFTSKYDDYKPFTYEGEGRVEFQHSIEQRKYEKIIEKQMMGEFGFHKMEHINPVELEAYEWDKKFAFRAAIINMQYAMKLGSLRMVHNLYYVGQGDNNNSNSKAA